MPSRGLKAKRLPKRKQGGVCLDCACKDRLVLEKCKVLCTALSAAPIYREIPHGPCGLRKAWERQMASRSPSYITTGMPVAAD